LDGVWDSYVKLNDGGEANFADSHKAGLWIEPQKEAIELYINNSSEFPRAVDRCKVGIDSCWLY
jgi:hypothetical protein